MNAHGNSATANKLKTERNIKIQGAVSGNVSFDGSKDVIITTTQANIAILNGTMTLEANSNDNISQGIMKQTIGNINYPSKFNKNNCIVICFAGKLYENREWNYGDASGGGLTSLGSLNGGIPRDIVLNDDHISVNVFNVATSQRTFWYKIVLMKVA